jgi:bleomycin hydrolase
MKKILCLIFVVLIIPLIVHPQQKDKGVFVEPQKGFWDEIEKTIKEFNKKEEPKKRNFKVDLKNYDAPKGLDEFTQVWANPPVSQGQTNTCWCFSTTSFLESEIYRQTGKKVRISEAFTVYNEYIERVKRFISERGNSAVAEGSEANAVTREWKMNGCMPWDTYPGLKPEQKFHDHFKMFDEIKVYLNNIKTTNAWNEEEAIRTVKSILNHYLGIPPEKFVVDGKEYTPKEYLNDYLKLNPDDYVDVLSYMQQPYGEQVEYEVPDNWWHSKEYYNVPLDTFMKILKNAVRKGYTVSIGGDISEPGKDPDKKVFMIPTFDIPSEFIDENARQYRFTNGSTTDDHGIHLIGFKEVNGKDWYLIKDSGSSSFNTEPKGYYFFTEDYVKLKMMDFMVHKDAVKDFIEVK